MEVDPRTLAYGRLAVREAVQSYLYYPNVHLIDFGYPEHGGEIDENDLAIRIHVTEKLSGPQLEAAVDSGETTYFPPSIGGFPVDRPKGMYRPHQWFFPVQQTNPRAIHSDPMHCGISISDERHNAYGTLGALVVDRQTGEEMMLSNWHVLASDWIARPGQRIYQAGRLDGGAFRDTAAALSRHAMSSSLDAAVAALNGKRRLLNDQLGLGPVRGVGQAHLGMNVVKSGRRTDITYGLVTAVEGIAKMKYGPLYRTILHILTIEPHSPLDSVSGPGDSGSCWVEQGSMRAVGLHFAGSNDPERALAMSMPAVLDALDVDLVVEG